MHTDGTLLRITEWASRKSEAESFGLAPRKQGGHVAGLGAPSPAAGGMGTGRPPSAF